MKMMNCWEFMRCGKKGESCKAATAQWADGINEGQNAGRFCWAIAGTFAMKLEAFCRPGLTGSCLNCDFFNRVKEEEGAHFQVF